MKQFSNTKSMQPGIEPRTSGISSEDLTPRPTRVVTNRGLVNIYSIINKKNVFLVTMMFSFELSMNNSSLLVKLVLFDILQRK